MNWWQDEISGDVFDLLLSLSDFGEFKELMLEHKRWVSHSIHERQALPFLETSFSTLFSTLLLFACDTNPTLPFYFWLFFPPLSNLSFLPSHTRTRQKRQGPREASDLDSLLMHRSAASSAVWRSRLFFYALLWHLEIVLYFFSAIMFFSIRFVYWRVRVFLVSFLAFPGIECMHLSGPRVSSDITQCANEKWVTCKHALRIKARPFALKSANIVVPNGL